MTHASSTMVLICRQTKTNTQNQVCRGAIETSILRMKKSLSQTHLTMARVAKTSLPIEMERSSHMIWLV